MKFFEKTYKYSYNYLGTITRTYIVYKILFFKITRRVYSNILISGSNNNFFIKMENGDLKKIHNSDKTLQKININIHGKNNVIILSPDLNFINSTIEICGDNSKLEIKKSSELIQASRFYLQTNSKITVEENFKSNGCNIIATTDTEVKIGKRCMTGRNISIRTTDGHKICDSKTNEKLNLAKSVEIGDRVWLADNVVVLKGSKIRNDCVVGINSTVTKTFEETNCVIAGNPAKIVKRGVIWEK